MQWTLSDEQRDYQAALRSWLTRTAAPASVRGWLDAGDTTSFGQRFEADGWAGVGIPEELGGQGGGLVELAITAEELGRVSAPSAGWLAGVLTAPVGGGVLALPAEAVPHLVAPCTGGNPVARVPRVLAGDVATSFLRPTVVDGMTALRRVAAAHVETIPRHLLDRSRSAADVTFADAPTEHVECPDVTAYLLQASARAAVLVAADALGASQQMLDLCVAYAGHRTAFGVTIGSFQAVKHAAAEMLVDVEAARSAVYYAAASVEAQLVDHLLHAAATKAQVTARAARAADVALTLHGAIGYTWEHDLQLSYQRARLDAVLAGTPEQWNEVVADGLALV
ncbi:MAG: acyl-CoA dehydrogenase [Marmoricola sp.]|nr:acyl-CoA dehydrogenase [Marmoricola sp.]